MGERKNQIPAPAGEPKPSCTLCDARHKREPAAGCVSLADPLAGTARSADWSPQVEGRPSACHACRFRRLGFESRPTPQIAFMCLVEGAHADIDQGGIDVQATDLIGICRPPVPLVFDAQYRATLFGGDALAQL